MGNDICLINEVFIGKGSEIRVQEVFVQNALSMALSKLKALALELGSSKQAWGPHVCLQRGLARIAVE